MDSFTGLKALRKKIELILQKLNMYQETMNEISREELLEIMGNNDLDLSWIASQESVDALRMEIDSIKKMVNTINKSTMKTIGTAAELDSIFKGLISGSYMSVYGPVVTDPEGEVTIYSQYIGGSSNTAYPTKLTSGGTSNRYIRLTKCSSLTIQDNVTLPSDTRYDIINEICRSNCNLVSVDIGNLIGYIGGNTLGRFTTSNGNLNRYGMFSGCTKLSNVSIGYMYTQNAVGMFDGCESLTSLDLTGLKIDANGEVDEMFYGCTNLKEILVSRSKFPESFKSSTDMFTGCGVDHVTYVD